MADDLLVDWPAAVPGLHRLAFDDGNVQLLLAAGCGGARNWLPQLATRVDAFFIDGDTLTGDTDRSWPRRLFKAAGRLAAADATLVVPAPGDAARAALRSAGFVSPIGGADGDRLPAAQCGTTAVDSLWCGRYAPAFAPRRITNRRASSGAAPPERHAIIVGAGLAGCAAAWALAELGWSSTLLDRQESPAREASGNPGGLFHGVVHPQDGAHARFNRAAALEAQRAVRIAIARHGVQGGADGLLRIETDGFAAPPDTSSLGDGTADAGVAADYARIVDAAEASALAGVPIAHRCWYFPGGGWVRPAGLARAFIERGGARVRFAGGVAVASLRRCERSGRPDDDRKDVDHEQPSAGPATRWQLIDPVGRVLGESAVVVLAHAGDASALLAGTALSAVPRTTAPPTTSLQTVRGQLSMLPVADLAQALPGLALPRLPIVGAGWLLPEVDGLAVFGATAQAEDADPAVRASDHAANIAALGRLTGLRFADEPPASVRGRTAWRCVAADRLPLIGAVPCVPAERDGSGDDEWADASQAVPAVPARPAAGAEWAGGADRIEHMPRVPGLYTFSALGSRGITWAALGAQVLASLITGAPVPVSRGLIEAVDPGRFLLRRQRRRPRC